MIYSKVKTYNKVMVVTEEAVNNTFAQSIAARIQQNCFQYLDAPVITVGSETCRQFLLMKHWRKPWSILLKN